MKLNLKNLKGAIAAGMLVLALTAIGVSQQGGPHGGPREGGFRGGPGPRGGVGAPFLRDLDLSDEQKAQVQKLTESFEAATRSLHEQLRTLHESHADSLGDGTFDETAVRKAAQERAGVEVELEVARARLHSQIFAVLTAEQKAKIAERRQQFEQRRQARGERGPANSQVQ
jgi:Spy/CpxP family protein refolding chaperone